MAIELKFLFHLPASSILSLTDNDGFGVLVWLQPDALSPSPSSFSLVVSDLCEFDLDFSQVGDIMSRFLWNPSGSSSTYEVATYVTMV